MGFRTAEESSLNRHGTDANAAHGTSPGGWRLKRCIDITGASAILLLAGPLLLVLGFVIRLQDGGKAIFSQERIGRHGKRFKCYKLRTMVPDAQEQLERLLSTCPDAQQQWEQSQKLDNDPRITRIGHFLRKSSLDELPQLLNVLRGDMSLVGPRPIVENEVRRYGVFYADYCSVQPGLTGLWQIKGRSDTSYADRVELDVEYARSRSLFRDMGILLMTVPAVLFSRGAK